MHQFDIIALCETQKQSAPQYIDKTTWESTIVGSENNKKGTGLLVLHRRALQAELWRKNKETETGGLQRIWLRIPASTTALPNDVMLGCIYMPPGRPTTNNGDGAKMWTKLKQDIKAARLLGEVIIMGDFNARVRTADGRRRQAPEEPDRVSPPGARSTDGGPPPTTTHPQADNCAQTNPYGTQLKKLVASQSLVLLTGRAPGDVPPRASFFGTRGGSSRVDHVLVSTALAARVAYHAVADWDGTSDHAPVDTKIITERDPRDDGGGAHPPAAAARPLRWHEDTEALYASELTWRLQAFEDEASEMPVDTLNDRIEQAVEAAARAADMVARHTPHAPRRPHGRRNAPWFDDELRVMLTNLRALQRASPGSPAARVAKADFKREARRKKRAYLLPRGAYALRLLKSNKSRTFWKTFFGRHSRLPPALRNASAAAAHFAAAFTAPAQPACTAMDRLQVYGGRRGTAEQQEELDNAFTETDIMEELLALRNGSAAGPAQLPPEFFKYAREAGDDDGGDGGGGGGNGGAHLLAGPLTTLFNKCFTEGRVPTSWTRSLLTPVPKNGAQTASFAECRPIAVGSVLPKLYARVLNRRLTEWAEEHRKHALEQAGFRNSMSTEQHLLHLQHCYDVCQQPDAKPLYLAFVDLKQAYDSVNRDLL